MKKIKQVWNKIDNWYWSWNDAERGMFEIFAAFVVDIAVFMAILWLIDLIFGLGWCK